MNAPISRREFLQAGAALIVGFSFSQRATGQREPQAETAIGKSLDTSNVDGFIAINRDGSVTVYSGKVDLGQGLRIAIPQMAAEELGVGVDRILLVEGDTALTPDQGATGGSTGIMRGGVQIRQAAATARQALLVLAAKRSGKSADTFDIVDGEIRAKAGDDAYRFSDLVADQRLALKVDAKAKLRDPSSYKVVGKPLPRPDVPDKVCGRHRFLHDFKLEGMLHARVVRAPSTGASLVDVDETSISAIPGARVVRVRNLLAVVGNDEWDAVCAMRLLKARWSDGTPLVGSDGVREWMRAGPFESDETLVKKGDARQALASATKVAAEFYWPVQSHASLGPSCAVADVRDGKATVWSASQATHRFHETIAKALALPKDAVRIVYLDGSGCYGMNGHDDAAADAALISKALGKPVRVQWSRNDEHGFDPKAPPQLLALEGSVTSEGRIDAWRTQMWIPKATASLPHMPLLALDAAGISQSPGITTGLISQNGDPPYAVANQEVIVHWLKDAPLRPSNFRAPGKVANCFAVESFTDMLAAAAKRDAVEFRLQALSDPRAIEVIRRAASLIGWQARPAPAPARGAGRGFAYIHYKQNESYVAVAMEAEVDRSSGAIRVRRVACAHDCGLVINPAALRTQIEGNILQTLSRTLFEETTFDRKQVTSVDWASYRILTFPDAPQVLVDIVDRPTEPPLGAGEASATPVPAALANAVFDATGVRLTTVPFTRERVRAALA